MQYYDTVYYITFGRNYLNKVFIDSRFKTTESRSDSDFTIELSDNMELEPNIGCIVQDITIPHTWYNINQTNNGLYFMMNANEYIVRLTPRNYDIYELAGALEEAMNVATNAVVVDAFTVTANANAGTLTIGVGGAVYFTIFNDADLLTRVNGQWFGEFYSPQNPMSINAILRINGRALEVYNANKFYTTGFIDLQPLHSLYLASNRLSTYSNLGPASQRNILKKILITTNFGEVNTSTDAWHDDKVNVGGLSLKLLDFQLRDAYGNVIDLNGAHITFSLLFVRM